MLLGRCISVLLTFSLMPVAFAQAQGLANIRCFKNAVVGFIGVPNGGHGGAYGADVVTREIQISPNQNGLYTVAVYEGRSLLISEDSLVKDSVLRNLTCRFASNLTDRDQVICQSSKKNDLSEVRIQFDGTNSSVSMKNQVGQVVPLQMEQIYGAINKADPMGQACYRDEPASVFYRRPAWGCVPPADNSWSTCPAK